MEYNVKAEQAAPVAEAVEPQDALSEMKTHLQNLSKHMRAQHMQHHAAPLAGDAVEDMERKQFVEDFLRKGQMEAVAQKSIHGNDRLRGGALVPPSLDAMIDSTLRNLSPVRQIANIVQVGSANYRKLITRTGIASGWVSEIEARPETATPDFIEIAPPMGELYANPAASQAMLEDALFDIENWLANEIAVEFARAEGQAFVTGNGTNRPKGFLTGSTSAQDDNSRGFGTLQHIATGAAGNFAASNPQEKLVDLVHALKPGYRKGAVWLMSTNTLARIRKMRTSDGDFLWRKGLEAGQPELLLGYPVIEAPDMPEIAADSLSVAFGNFQMGYVIAERRETRVLRDPYSNKPFVHFYATRRVGGAVVNSEAIKLLKFSAA